MKTITHIRESKFENYCDFCDKLESQCVCGPNEEVAANSVSGGGVDMNTTGVAYKHRDKRRKEDVNVMYRRSLGMRYIQSMIEKRKKTE
jgi:hypothetical protein